ncbi:MAG: pyruvate formate-lyase-activating protein [Lachnospiraceae bacterium]|nr:pyruvate formate-lyase-activating protein [Lachnospiraceae bacterium]
MQGRIHSIESFGTVDGPGTRFVVFLQGCPMRCLYCHNPDTWAMDGGKMMTAEEIFAQYERNRGFYKEGGITVTGGEPLMQIDFLTLLFDMAKDKDVHTCLDTSGIAFNRANERLLEKLEKLLELTDLVMLDIKHINPETHQKLTSQPNKNILDFAAYLSEQNIDVWIRHVVVPGISDDNKELYNLGYYIGQFHNIKALDVLPYHTMGVSKYEQLGIPYPLAGVPAMNREDILEKKQMILAGIKERRKIV